MNYVGGRNALQQYKQINVQTGVTQATPHRLIQMLMEGALEKIAMAKGFMGRGEVAEKGSHISWAISIIDGLRMSLDKDSGGAVAANLDRLYDYMERQLLLANTRNEPALLDEVAGLMREIKSGWDAIPENYHHGVSAQQQVRAAGA